jgi:hypothetical protein
LNWPVGRRVQIGQPNKCQDDVRVLRHGDGRRLAPPAVGGLR